MHTQIREYLFVSLGEMQTPLDVEGSGPGSPDILTASDRLPMPGNIYNVPDANNLGRGQVHCSCIILYMAITYGSLHDFRHFSVPKAIDPCLCNSTAIAFTEIDLGTKCNENKV